MGFITWTTIKNYRNTDSLRRGTFSGQGSTFGQDGATTKWSALTDEQVNLLSSPIKPVIVSLNFEATQKIESGFQKDNAQVELRFLDTACIDTAVNSTAHFSSYNFVTGNDNFSMARIAQTPTILLGHGVANEIRVVNDASSTLQAVLLMVQSFSLRPNTWLNADLVANSFMLPLILSIN